MNNCCTRKLIKKLRNAYTEQTDSELESFADPKFSFWLQENDPIGETEYAGRYVILEQKNFAKAIMDAYVASINQISQLLDKRDTEKSYTKSDVLDLISDAFSIAKTEGEARIRQISKY